jgi:hypothetical protein
MAVGPRAGQKVFSLQSVPLRAPESRQGVAQYAGFSRLDLTAQGQVRYRLKTPYRDGTTHIVLEPLDARSDTLSVYDAVEPALVREVELGMEGDQSSRLFGGLSSLFGSSNAAVPIGIQAAPGRVWIALAARNRVTEVNADTWTAMRTSDAGEEPDGMAWSVLVAVDD